MLRTAAPEDRELLCRIYAATRTDELAAVNWDDAAKESFVRMQFEAQHTYYTENYTGASFSVVLCNSEPCGRFYTVQWESEIRIMDIAILPEFRNRGIGTHLLNKIIAEGERLSLPVSIHVERLNPALRLYDRLGFDCIEDKGVYLLLRRSVRPSMPDRTKTSVED